MKNALVADPVRESTIIRKALTVVRPAFRLNFHHGIFAVRLRNDRVLVELSPGEFEHLCEAMRLHSDGHVEGERAIRACWDADRLDLGRVGIEPHPQRLCTPHARERQTINEASRMAEGLPRRS